MEASHDDDGKGKKCRSTAFHSEARHDDVDDATDLV